MHFYDIDKNRFLYVISFSYVDFRVGLIYLSKHIDFYVLPFWFAYFHLMLSYTFGNLGFQYRFLLV